MFRIAALVVVAGSIAVLMQGVFASTWLALSSQAEKEAGSLVVMIESDFAGEKKLGAGIVFAEQVRSMYIVTANHNVRRGGAFPRTITVWLNGDLDHPFKAELEPHFDRALDLAVLSITVKQSEAAIHSPLPFDRIRDPSGLQRGDYVFPMGYPLGRAWAISIEPDRFTGMQRDRLFFESNFIAPGHSGGALWDQNLRLAGLILSDQPPHGSALSISRVISTLTEWKYQVDLGSPNHRPVFAMVAPAWRHACALSDEGRAYCFGNNISGLLGSGTEGSSFSPLRVTGQRQFIQIDAGRDFACGVDTHNHLWCWGANHMGAIGDGSPGDPQGKKDPVAVAHDAQFSLVSVGTNGACALSLEGQPWCWGALSERRKTPHPLPVKGKYSWIDVGESIACGLTEGGSTYCWSLIESTGPYGSEFGGEIAIADWPELQRIFLAEPVNHGGIIEICGISDDDKVYCSQSFELEPFELETTLRFPIISVGGNHACGLAQTGEAWCWGDNYSGQLGNGTTTLSDSPVKVRGGMRFIDLSCGPESTCGTTKNGELVCWGKISSFKSLEPLAISSR